MTARDFERECLEAEIEAGREVMAENERIRALRDVEPITLAQAHEQLAEREATIALRDALAEVSES